MTKKILLLAFCLGVHALHAQPSLNAASANAKNAAGEEAETLAAKDIFAFTAYGIKNNVLTFTGLPTDKHLRVYITNADGTEVYNKKLNPATNTIDLNKIGKGLYYITIISKDDKRKAFAVNL